MQHRGFRRVRHLWLLMSVTVFAMVVSACGSETSNPSEPGTTPAATTESSAGPTATSVVTAPSATEPPGETSTAARNVDLALYSDGAGGVSWVSPTGNVWCRIAPEMYASGCQSMVAPVPDGADCTKPNFDANGLSKGFFLFPDRVQPMCFNQGVFAVVENRKVLEYDTSISSAGYTCTSRTSGMTCTTGNGHGFELSAEVARSF